MRSDAKRVLIPVLAALFIAVIVYWPNHASLPDRAFREWAAYGGDEGQTRYSALAQINRSNVNELRVAWTFDTGEVGGLQTNPLVVDGVAYVLSPTHRVFALDAATGDVKWVFDSGIPGRGPNRGLMYWSGEADARIYAAQSHYLYALDAETGTLVSSFGRDGRIDLREDLDRDPELQSVLMTTPGAVYDDLLIVGGRVSENLPASPGYIRAYDARTGQRVWTFHTIPHPGEFGHETWPEDAWTYTGGANSWAGLTVDVVRGIVYAPTGSAASDFYGANRAGDNLFANSLLALDAATGERLWHFQVVQHDTWDRDLASPPTLVSTQRDGRRIDAVAQATKHGQLFLFDRSTGEPLFPIEYRAYPASDVEGERSAASQPMPIKPAPFARQRLTEADLTQRTILARNAALAQFRSVRSDGQFIPLAVGQPTVVFPGFDGGAEWGGAAFDPESGVLYINANEMAWLAELAENTATGYGRQVYERDCASCHGDELQGSPPQIPALANRLGRMSDTDLGRLVRSGAGRMAGFPGLPQADLDALINFIRNGDANDEIREGSLPKPRYRFTGFNKFLDPDGYPAISPPWGTLNAIDLSTGEYLWRIPFGEYPELVAQGLGNTGSENYGGPIVTAGGLLFIGATNFDKKFRAFDKATGELLWQTTLPFSANGTPATYAVDGRQFVLVPSGGGKSRPNGDDESGGMYVAFALSESN